MQSGGVAVARNGFVRAVQSQGSGGPYLSHLGQGLSRPDVQGTIGQVDWGWGGEQRKRVGKCSPLCGCPRGQNRAGSWVETHLPRRSASRGPVCGGAMTLGCRWRELRVPCDLERLDR